MVPQGGVGGMNGFELQAQTDHADIFLIFYSKHRFRVYVRAALVLTEVLPSVNDLF